MPTNLKQVTFFLFLSHSQLSLTHLHQPSTDPDPKPLQMWHLLLQIITSSESSLMTPALKASASGEAMEKWNALVSLPQFSACSAQISENVNAPIWSFLSLNCSFLSEKDTAASLSKQKRCQFSLIPARITILEHYYLEIWWCRSRQLLHLPRGVLAWVGLWCHPQVGKRMITLSIWLPCVHNYEQTKNMKLTETPLE